MFHCSIIYNFLTTGIRTAVFVARFVSNMETIMNDMEKLNGANFSLWKSQMEDILILKDQCLPIEGAAKKPSMMADEDWKKLDRKSIATIRQYFKECVLQCG